MIGHVKVFLVLRTEQIQYIVCVFCQAMWHIACNFSFFQVTDFAISNHSVFNLETVFAWHETC